MPPMDPPSPAHDRSMLADTAHALTRALTPRLPSFLHELRTLVDMDSGTFDREDVQRVGAWVTGRCAAWGAEREVNPGGESADSFALTLRGDGNARLLLLAHMDTVFPHGAAATRPFRIEGDRALGPGVCDMKAGLLSAIYAIEALREIGFTGYGTLRLVCTSDEEVGAPSSRAFIERLAQGVTATLVMECGRENGDIVGQRKGGGFYRLEVKGRSAHAGVEPEKGRSAALTLSQQVVALHALTDLRAGRTVNVGTLRAGSRPNVVPDEAVAEVDLRANTLADMDLLLAQVTEALASSAIDGTTYTWTPMQFRPPWERNPGTDRLAALAQTLAHSLGFDVRAAATGGTSDGNFTAALGIPTLDGLGPVGGLDHGPLEYVEIASIVPRAALLASLIAAIATE